MEVLLLIACVFAAWFLGTTLDRLPDLGQLLVPSHWMLAVAGLALAILLLRD
jgi:hypothetical protein